MPGIPDSFDNPFARKVLMYTGQIACESSKDREDQSGGVQNPSRSQDLSPGRVAVPPRALIFPLPWHSACLCVFWPICIMNYLFCLFLLCHENTDTES